MSSYLLKNIQINDPRSPYHLQVGDLGIKDGKICNGNKNLRANLNNLNLNTTGYLYVGNNRDFTNGVGPGFSGLLSSFSSYNYELNQQDIYNIYNEGPVTGFWAKLGLGSYGVRNPVYKL